VSSANALAQEFAAANAELIALLEQASPEHWRMRTADEGELRPVGVIAHHVAEAHARIARRVEACAAGQPVPARHPELFDARNAQEARDHPDPDQRTTIERLRQTGAAVVALIARLSDLQLAQTASEDPGAPTLTTEQLIELRQIGHVRSHLATLRSALGDDRPPRTEPWPLGSQGQAFDVPPEIAYFNTANLAPQLHVVKIAGVAALERRGRPWTIHADDWFTDVEHLRGLFGQLMGSDAEGVALVPATSYGFAVAARNRQLKPGDRVLVLADEYPSGIYTWRAATRQAGAELLTVTRHDGQTWAEAVLAALDERVAVVSVPQVHWTDGALVDLHAVAPRSREVGAWLVIDGSQSIGAMPLDVQELKPDFVVTVGYKWLLGPLGAGYLYVAEEHRSGTPLEQNWILRAGSEDFARLVDYRDEYLPGARRFDVGERTNFELTPMAIAALTQLQDWGVAKVAAALRTVTDELAAAATGLGLAVAPPDQRGPHLLGLQLPADVRQRILPALAERGCFAAVRGSSLRIAPHLHTTSTDIQRLVAALAQAVGSAEPEPGPHA
jgi:selenocysteine lyase/cysteine desulfurase